MAIALTKFDQLIKEYDLIGYVLDSSTYHDSNKLVIDEDNERCLVTWHIIKHLLEENKKLKSELIGIHNAIDSLHNNIENVQERIDQSWDLTHARIDAIENPNM